MIYPDNSQKIQTYYLPASFVIDKAGQVYFISRSNMAGFVGQELIVTLPEFIDLIPKDLVRVPISDITEFVKINILNLDNNFRRVAMIFIKDTIKSKKPVKLFKVFNDGSSKIKWT